MIGQFGAIKASFEAGSGDSKGLPKPGSTNVMPVVAPPGGWPPFTGKPGPKQQKCVAMGGAWIGPTGKKWCQMPTRAVPVPYVPPVSVAPPPVGTPTYYPPPVDNSLVPVGEGGSPPGSPLYTDEQVIQDFITGGNVPPAMSAGATAPSTSGTTFSPAMLVAAAVASGVVFLVLRNKKGGKTGAARSKKRRK